MTESTDKLRGELVAGAGKYRLRRRRQQIGASLAAGAVVMAIVLGLVAQTGSDRAPTITANEGDPTSSTTAPRGACDAEPITGKLQSRLHTDVDGDGVVDLVEVRYQPSARDEVVEEDYRNQMQAVLADGTRTKPIDLLFGELFGAVELDGRPGAEVFVAEQSNTAHNAGIKMLAGCTWQTVPFGGSGGENFLVTYGGGGIGCALPCYPHAQCIRGAEGVVIVETNAFADPILDPAAGPPTEPVTYAWGRTPWRFAAGHMEQGGSGSDQGSVEVPVPIPDAGPDLPVPTESGLWCLDTDRHYTEDDIRGFVESLVALGGAGQLSSSVALNPAGVKLSVEGEVGRTLAPRDAGEASAWDAGVGPEGLRNAPHVLATRITDRDWNVGTMGDPCTRLEDRDGIATLDDRHRVAVFTCGGVSVDLYFNQAGELSAVNVREVDRP